MRPEDLRNDSDKPKELSPFANHKIDETEWYKTALNTADQAAEFFKDNLRDKGYDESIVNREGAGHRASVLQEMVRDYENARNGGSAEGTDVLNDSAEDDDWTVDSSEDIGEAEEAEEDGDWVMDSSEDTGEAEEDDIDWAGYDESKQPEGSVHLELEADSEVVAEGDFDINDEDAEISATVPAGSEVVAREVVEVEDPDLEEGEVEEEKYENDQDTVYAGESEYVEPSEITVRRVGTGEATEDTSEDKAEENPEELSEENAEENSEETTDEITEENSEEILEELSEENPGEIPEEATEELTEEEQVEILEAAMEGHTEEEQIEILEEATEEYTQEEQVETLEEPTEEVAEEEQIETLEEPAEEVTEEEQIETLEEPAEEVTEEQTETLEEPAEEVAEEEQIETLEEPAEENTEEVQTEIPEENPEKAPEEAADGTDKELFGLERFKELTPTNEVVRRRLEDCGITDIELDGVLDKYQEVLAKAVEEMNERYPELKGYITKIRATKLQPGVFACAGPRMGENGYSTEININIDEFAHRGLEFKVSNMETPNWLGQTWFAGHGKDAIFKHEIGHILHLRMLAKERGIELGEKNIEAFNDLCKAYNDNLIVSKICSDSMIELGISPKDLAKNISIYGASDMGECFAEAISEVETRKNPREFARKVYEKYQEVKK